MKKLLIIWFGFMALPMVMRSQAFEKGKLYASASYGVAPFFNLFYNMLLDADSLNDIKLKSIGPIYGKLEYAVGKRIGLGISAAYMNSVFSYSEKSQYYNNATNSYDTYTQKWSVTRNTFSIMGRFNFHFFTNDKWDMYMGAGLGFRDATWKSKYEVIGLSGNNTPPDSTENVDMSKFPIAFETTVGFKYLLTPNLGLFAEAGFAKSLLQFGISTKL
jgi:opacity protein-like surface antigen